MGRTVRAWLVWGKVALCALALIAAGFVHAYDFEICACCGEGRELNYWLGTWKEQRSRSRMASLPTPRYLNDQFGFHAHRWIRRGRIVRLSYWDLCDLFDYPGADVFVVLRSFRRFEDSGLALPAAARHVHASLLQAAGRRDRQALHLLTEQVDREAVRW
jgi:hypothetical protein